MKNKPIEVIEPDSGEFEKVSESIRHRSLYNIDYNELAENYNKAAVGSIILIDAGASVRTNNVIATIKNRGLKYKVDFHASKLIQDTTGAKISPEERPIALVKQTEKEMGLK